jgi:DNA polymerase III psi subunit
LYLPWAYAVRHWLDQAYLDKLDGKISEEFRARKSAEWIAEEQQISFAIQGLANANPDRIMDAVRILKLANKAHFLYVSQSAPEKAKLLLRTVLSNCTVDAVNIYVLYKQPFDLIFARATNEEWCARRDSNSRPTAPEAAALSS